MDKIKNIFIKEKGQAIVETAIVLPLFLMIVFTIMQLGMVFTAKYIVNYAAYSACRIGIVRDADEETIKKGIRIILVTLEQVTSNINTICSRAESSDYKQKIDNNLNLTVEKNNPTEGVLYVKVEYNYNMTIPFGNLLVYTVANITDKYKMWSYEYEEQAKTHAQSNFNGEYRLKLISEYRMRMQ